MSSGLSDSDDDDDFYINTAARLKALKTQRHEEKKFDCSQDISIDERDTVSDKKEDESSLDIPIAESPELPCDEDSNIILAESDVETENDCTFSPHKLISSQKIGLIEDKGAISLDDDSDDDLDISKIPISTIRVTIRWKSRLVERLELEMNEPFSKVFHHFSTMENVPPTQILLMRKGVRIQPTDTPETLKLSIIDVLEGGCVDLPNVLPQANLDPDSGKCAIKIQTSGKQSLSFKLKHDENFSSLATYCSEKLNVPISKLKFYCDGDVIQETDTPEGLDFDDEGCIDLKVLS